MRAAPPTPSPVNDYFGALAPLLRRLRHTLPQLPGCGVDLPVFRTLAIPENGNNGPIFRTQAEPENGGGPIARTQAFPENGGGIVTTMAIPENPGDRIHV